MKIVVDIDDEKYKAISNYIKVIRDEALKNGYADNDVTPIGWVAIADGTPLPKGHGDLKDAEKLKSAFITWSMAVRGNFTDADIASIIYNSPTIIEADKEE